MKKIGKLAIWQLMSVVIDNCIADINSRSNCTALKLPRNLKYSPKKCILRFGSARFRWYVKV